MTQQSTRTDRLRRTVAYGVALWETASRGATYNPLSRRVVQNPYGVYAALRRRSPVHRSAILGSWVLTRYDDVAAAAKDHERFSNNPRWREATTSVLPPAPDDYSILLMDPPDHSRLRRVASRAFTRARLTALGETIARSAAELVERAVRRGTVDWVSEVAAPLSMRVMLEMMGIPGHERRRWETWVPERARLLEMIAARDQRRAAHRTGNEIQRYFTALLHRRSESEEDDAVSTFARQVATGEGISMAEASDMLSVLMIAGNETTTNLIGNGMLALLRHPDQLSVLRDDPSLMPAAVNELLRFDSPVQSDFRAAVEDCEVNGFPVRSGESIILLLGSANHDPAVFDRPERLDVRRGEGNHIAFGRGIHHCLGAFLARLEGRIAFEMLLERFPSIRLLTDRPVFRSGIVLRGLESLPLGAGGPREGR